MRESNPRPLPPEGRIIPLDQRPQRASNEDRTRDLVLTRHMLCLGHKDETADAARYKNKDVHLRAQKVLPGLEPGLKESESLVMTITL